MDRLFITDVAPRDGLQNVAVSVSADQKVALVDGLVAAGIASVEVTSFVSPKAVPQLADAAEVLTLVRRRHPALRDSVLVPNLKGLERAHAQGAREIAVVLSATETMNRKNINMGLPEATAMSVDTLKRARDFGLRTRAYVAVAFDCPFEGPTSLATVRTLAAQLAEAGADEVVIADTIGSASPATVQSHLRAICTDVPADRLAVHFHDTRGMGLANAWAALQAGVRRFDSSVGGMGGCPFSPGATGNLATEDLVLLAQGCGLETGVSLDGLLDVIDMAQHMLQQPLGGRSIAWLRRERQKRIDAR